MVLGAKVRHNARELLSHIKGHLYGHGGLRVKGLSVGCGMNTKSCFPGFRYRFGRVGSREAQESRTP